MDVGGFGIHAIAPIGQAMPSARSNSSLAFGASSDTPSQASGRLNELVNLIKSFSPSEVLSALLLATTTYRQSQAPVTVSAAEIGMQLATQNDLDGFSRLANFTGHSQSAGVQFSIQG